VDELPGNLAKVYVAWGYLSASKAIHRIAVSGETPQFEERIQEATWRAVDILIAATFLVAVVPLFSIVALCLKLEGPGPVMFRQKRLGACNLPFDLLKFRTMSVDTDALAHQLNRSRENPRITRVGRFIRRLGLDELPQLINVLRGEMSLVGPRAHPPVENAASVYPGRHRLKPGITGWAQINEPPGKTTSDRIRRQIEDGLYYIKNKSLRLDLLIIWRTIIGSLFRRYEPDGDSQAEPGRRDGYDGDRHRLE
jgi:putative colanic acid biosynthesis UDP-glucose lipid carrier transferase